MLEPVEGREVVEQMDTIYALSSGALPSGVAVVRLSGPQCSAVLAAMCGDVPEPRRAVLRTIRSHNGDALDDGLAIFFSGPASFTGEDCAELQLHGGRAVVSAVMAELALFEGLRHAESGEFSRRAFHNGKLDLVEVEGLADLIAAQTEMQRRLAREHADGGQSRLYEGWAKRLTHARAMIEAELDFADEGDVPGSVANAVWSDMRLLRTEVAAHLERAPIAEIIRDGLKVVIAGPPNVGKSSLLNALAKRDVAIVTDIAGTTRDILTLDLDLDGFSVRIYDTAGLRHAAEPIEIEGIRRARLAISEADLVLLLSDGFSDESDLDESAYEGRTIRVRTKIDLGDRPVGGEIGISVHTGEGLTALTHVIGDYLRQIVGVGVASLPTRERHVQRLRGVLSALDASMDREAQGLEFRAEFLRLAAHELGKITGRVDVEQLLDVIFSQFCIGK